MRRNAVLGAFIVAVIAAASSSALLRAAPQSGLIDVKSSLAGVVLAEDLIQVDDRVEDGQPLVYVRTTLTGSKGVAARAPRDGVVREVPVKAGQRVERGDVVVRIEPR